MLRVIDFVDKPLLKPLWRQRGYDRGVIEAIGCENDADTIRLQDAVKLFQDLARLREMFKYRSGKDQREGAVTKR